MSLQEEGMSKAISYFVSQGVRVSIPLFHNDDYDLIAEFCYHVQKVKVLTSAHVMKCAFRQNEPQGFLITINNDGKLKYDYLFIYTPDGYDYLIPYKDLPKRKTITVSPRTKYRVIEYELPDN